jgi:hypothetical protein
MENVVVFRELKDFDVNPSLEICVDSSEKKLAKMKKFLAPVDISAM